MQSLTSQQRKLLYLGCILVSLIPIIWLGMPAGSKAAGKAQGLAQGGQLSRLRAEYDLGESDLGNVDPSSATMNLVLLGFRGVAASVLSVELEEQKNTKNWAQMRATTESIIRLQPHYLGVWEYHGWNLAYNVSVEWDAIPDRYYWVKTGGKFYMTGSEVNAKSAVLRARTGEILGKKIGRSDEWSYFRKYFRRDPDIKTYGGRPDPDFNPDDKDNYLAAKDWYFRANDAEVRFKQRLGSNRIPVAQKVNLDRKIFRSYPARSQMDFADALQREGRFDEEGTEAWRIAFLDWTDHYTNGAPGYGQELFWDIVCGHYRLESTEADIRSLAESDKSPKQHTDNGATEDQANTMANLPLDKFVQLKKYWTDRFQSDTNYRYWRERARAEQEPETTRSLREIHEGKEAFKASRLSQAIALLESGMAGYAKMLQRHPDLMVDDRVIEDGMLAVYVWMQARKLQNPAEVTNFPLKPLWDKEQGRLPNIRQTYRREFEDRR